MYHNIGMDMKYPNPDKGKLSNKSYEELAKIKQEMKQQGLIEEKAKVQEKQKEEMRSKYGRID